MQLRELVSDAVDVDGVWPVAQRRVRDHDPDLGLRMRGPQLGPHPLELVPVPAVQDDVEPVARELERQTPPDPVAGPRDQGPGAPPRCVRVQVPIYVRRARVEPCCVDELV